MRLGRRDYEGRKIELFSYLFYVLSQRDYYNPISLIVILLNITGFTLDDPSTFFFFFFLNERSNPRFFPFGAESRASCFLQFAGRSLIAQGKHQEDGISICTVRSQAIWYLSPRSIDGSLHRCKASLTPADILAPSPSKGAGKEFS